MENQEPDNDPRAHTPSEQATTTHVLPNVANFYDLVSISDTTPMQHKIWWFTESISKIESYFVSRWTYFRYDIMCCIPQPIRHLRNV